jgi:hypothetical protein
MKWSDLPLKPTPRALRQFAAAWLGLFLLLALRQIFLRHQAVAGAALGAVALVGLAGLLKPAAVRWLFVGATIVSFPIGWLISQVVLGIMFYLVLTPVAMVFKLRGRDALQLRREPERSSCWMTREGASDPGRYLKQF